MTALRLAVGPLMQQGAGVDQVSVAGVGATATCTDGTLELTLPVGWSAGQVAYAFVLQTNVGSAASPAPSMSGWTLLTRHGAGGSAADIQPDVFRRVLQSGDSNPTASVSATNHAVGAIITVENSDELTIPTITSTYSSGSSTFTPPSTSPSGGDLVIAIVGANGNQGLELGTADQGFTEAFEESQSATNRNKSLLVATKEIGSTGSQTSPEVDLVSSTQAAILRSFVLSSVSTLGTLDEEIQDLNPLTFLKLDETSGTTATDSSGNGRHGTYTGTVTLGASGPNGENVVNLGGTGHVAIADASVFDLTPSYGLTVFVLVKRTSGGYIVNKGGVGSDYEWALNTGYSATVYSEAGGARSTVNAAGERSGEWNAIAAHFPSNAVLADIALFVNSATDAAGSPTNTTTDAFDPSPTNPIRVGSRGDAGDGNLNALVSRVFICAGAPDLARVFAAAEADGWI